MLNESHWINVSCLQQGKECSDAWENKAPGGYSEGHLFKLQNQFISWQKSHPCVTRLNRWQCGHAHKQYRNVPSTKGRWTPQSLSATVIYLAPFLAICQVSLAPWLPSLFNWVTSGYGLREEWPWWSRFKEVWPVIPAWLLWLFRVETSGWSQARWLTLLS